MFDWNTMAKIRLTGILLIILSLLLVGCLKTLPKYNILGPNTFKNSMDIRIDGVRRSYLVHIPSGYDHKKPLPLVVVIHGAFDTAEGMENYSGFSRLADRENFIVLYPSGMGIFGYFQHWNAGHCCGKAADDNWDDVGFVSAAIEDVQARLKIDSRRIYMVGFSNGGMFTYRFAAERGDLLAAAAPMAASIGGKPSNDAPEWRIPKPVKPLSMIIFHGLEDDDIPYEGGRSRHRGGTRTYWSVEESVKFWIMNNGCKQKATSTYLNEGSVNLKLWGICRNNTEVALYLIKGWGHVWPGKYFTSDLAENDPIRDFDASIIIWNFFKSHHRLP